MRKILLTLFVAAQSIIYLNAQILSLQNDNGNFENAYYLNGWLSFGSVSPSPMGFESSTKKVRINPDSGIELSNGWKGAGLKKKFKCVDPGGNFCRIGFTYQFAPLEDGGAAAYVLINGPVGIIGVPLPVSLPNRVEVLYPVCTNVLTIYFIVVSSNTNDADTHFWLDECFNECRDDDFPLYDDLITENSCSIETEACDAIDEAYNFVEALCKWVGPVCDDTECKKISFAFCDETCNCVVPVVNVPTLSQWSLIIFTLFMLIIGVVGIKNKSDESQLSYEQ